MDRVNHRLEHVEHGLCDLADWTEYTTEHLEVLINYNGFRVSVLELGNIISTMTRGVMNVVTNQRVSPDLLPPKLLARVHADVRAHAHSLGLELGLPAHAFYELPCTYTVASSTSFHVTLHVPLLTIPLDVFRLQPFPIEIFPDKGLALVEESSTLLAMTETRSSFVELTAHDLLLCTTFDSQYVCDLPALIHDTEHFCLAALYHGNWPSAAKYCTYVRPKKPWYLIRADKRNFKLYTNITMNPSSNCGKDVVKQLPPGFHEFTVPENCTLTTEFFYIDVQLEDHFETATVRYFNATDELTESMLRHHPFHYVVSEFNSAHAENLTWWSITLLCLAFVVIAWLGYMTLLHCWTCMSNRRRRRRSKQKPQQDTPVPAPPAPTVEN
jgi:hypothetical protein